MSYIHSKLKLSPLLISFMLGLLFSDAHAATVYEDAEDGTLSRWEVLDNSPSGAVVSNVSDSTIGSRVIKLDGAGTANAYMIGGFTNQTGWNNTTETVLDWKMRSSISFILNVRLDTELGPRYIRYKNTDSLPGMIGNTIDQGLGSNVADGTWHTFTRNLEHDLKSSEPNNTVLGVNGILVRGNIELDDINLSVAQLDDALKANAGSNQVVPFGNAVVLNGQASEAYQNPITSYSWLDSSDSVVSSNEVALLEGLAVGAHTFVLVVTNSVGEVDMDSVEVRIVESAISVYEDAEDESISRWEVRDDNPSGAIVSNVLESTLGSRVIETSGNGKSNAYLLGSLSTNDGWNNTSEFVLAWDMLATSSVIINIRVETVSGIRYLRYTNSTTPISRIGSTVVIGLGSDIIEGEWVSYSRDLDQDLKAYAPEDSILSVHGFLIRGDVILDNIGLRTNQVQDAPTAHAGPDQEINVGESVSLDSSGSVAGDYPIVSYHWFNGDALLSGERSPIIVGLPTGTYSITLLITDEAGSTSSDTVRVTVNDSSQVFLQADAGIDQTIEAGESVMLDASGSVAGSSPIASFRWLEGETLLSQQVSPTIQNLSEGIHRITLVVTDETGQSETDTVQITVNAAPVPLQAVAGPDQTIASGDSVQLDGSASSAGVSAIAVYRWLDGESLLSNEVNPTIDNLPVGMHIFTLVVTDESGASDTDTIQIEVLALGSELYVDVINGDDGNSGDLLNPFRSIAEAVKALEPGMTLIIREGTYFERLIDIDRSGTADNPIVIKNYPGENVIVDGSYQEFTEPNNGSWELVDSRQKLYRSLDTNYIDDIPVASILADNGSLISLVSYADRPESGANGLLDLNSSIQVVSNLPRYVGPGVFNDAGRIYIRLVPLESDAVHGMTITQAPSTDPNKLSLLVATTSPVFNVNGSHLHFQGFQVRGGGKGYKLNAVSNISFNAMKFAGLALGIDIRDNSSDIVVDGNEFDINFPDYLAWTDLKGGSAHSKPAAYWANRRGGISSMLVHDLTVTNNTFANAFDGMVLSGEDIKISRNKGKYIDDMVQLGSNSSHVEIYENEIHGTGPSHHGRGDSQNPGTIYIYSNTIDSREEILWKKRDDASLLNNYPNFHSSIPFERHNLDDLINGSPWNIYNNTVLFDSSEPGASAGYELWGDTNNTGHAHQVFNNIFLEVGGGAFTKSLNVNTDNHAYDGNIYWSLSSNGIFHDDFVTVARKGLDIDSLQEFRSSPEFNDSRAHYSPGWDANSLQQNPLLDSEYVPSINGPASILGVELPADFPNRRGLTYRGALKPQ